MRFYFDIPESDFEEEGGFSFRDAIIERAAETLLQEEMGEHIYSSISLAIKETIKSHEKEIVNTVVERVAEKIGKKREIVEITPKAKALADISKENESYFVDLIDKAIAKRFSLK